MEERFLPDQDLAIADVIAQALTQRRTDVNELMKAMGFLRDNPNGPLFFEYLDIVIAEGEAVVRSERTLGYYRAIRDACRQHLGPYKDKPMRMVQIIGWAARLMRFYAVEDKLGQVARRPPRRPRPAAAGDRRTGTVKWFNKSKGYGFIQPDGGGEDLFVHVSQTPDQQGLRDNQRVSFAAGKGPKGRPQAQDVKAE